MTRPGTQIKIEPFGGMIPAVDARLLPQINAEHTENVWLYDGKLRALRVLKDVHTLVNPDARSVYRIPLAGPLAENISSSLWLEFNGLNTSVIKSPTSALGDTTDRYYWCGDDPISNPRYNSFSRIRDGVMPLFLGVPVPSADPTVAPSGGVSATTEARAYVYTYVTVFGEEGPPSNPTATTVGKIDDTWVVTMPQALQDIGPNDITITGITKAAHAVVTAVAHGYALGSRVFFHDVVGMTEINGLYGTVIAVGDVDHYTVDIDSSGFSVYVSGGFSTKIQHELVKKRIYRTVTSDQGVATFFFVAETADILATTYNDTISSEDVARNEQLTTQTFEAPPSDLKGFVTFPNGMVIGWRDNEIWFSEPYFPHAWPSNYTLHVEFPIVGIGVVGQTAVICTEGPPSLCTGIHPSVMSLAKVQGTVYPCTSKNSIVSTPQGVVYASTEGLISVGPGGSAVATQGLLTKDDWQRLLVISKLNAALLNGAYYAYSGVIEGCFEETAFEETAFEMEDFTGSRNGGLIDLRDQRIAFNVLTNDTPIFNVIADPWSAEVLLVCDGVVCQVDLTSSSLEGQYTWRSKIFRMDIPTNIGVGVCFHRAPDGQPGAQTTLNVYATPLDDADAMTLIYSRLLPNSGIEFRLPSGRLHNFYQFELVGQRQIESLQFATTSKELRGL